MEKISELTPHTSQNQKKFSGKKLDHLKQLKNIFLRQIFKCIELKEFSLLYLIMNNLNLIQDNIHLVEGVKLFTKVNLQIFNEIISMLKSGAKISISDLEIDNQLIEKINKFAPIKHILKNKSGREHEILELFDDISRDLNNYDLEFRIQELESKFSKDLSEATFNELKELKKKQNIN